MREAPAAFRRLCVETQKTAGTPYVSAQPPLGGCVLKHRIGDDSDEVAGQPPLGGCVLKQFGFVEDDFERHQPPLGGCVLKL